MKSSMKTPAINELYQQKKYSLLYSESIRCIFANLIKFGRSEGTNSPSIILEQPNKNKSKIKKVVHSPIDITNSIRASTSPIRNF